MIGGLPLADAVLHGGVEGGLALLVHGVPLAARRKQRSVGFVGHVGVVDELLGEEAVPAFAASVADAGEPLEPLAFGRFVVGEGDAAVGFGDAVLHNLLGDRPLILPDDRGDLLEPHPLA